MQTLDKYRRKRNFQRTPEPAGPEAEGPDAEVRAAAEPQEGGEFVIHKHAARRLHYDLRLERDGVLKSWAVPKGPSLTPGEKRLAVRVEDHPLEYGNFEGVIPKPEYGAGTIMIWDRGRWSIAESRGRRKADEDRIDFVLAGQKLKGLWTLVRTSGRTGERGDNWLLIKRHDDALSECKVTELSVATGRTLDQIAADQNRTWTRADELDAPVRQTPDPKNLPGAKKKLLPGNFEPALATLDCEAPTGDDWLHEIKFDGYRILARCQGNAIQLITRNGKDWTHRFADIAGLLKNALESVAGEVVGEGALLDGEIVALEPDGTTSFGALQDALATGNTRGLVYQLFDLPYLGGYNLTAVPLVIRKHALAELLAASGLAHTANVRYTEHVQGQGPDFAEHACRLGLEGVVCKRAEGPYRNGRSRDWLKVKCTAREELIVCGYTEPGGARTGFGALLLGAWHDGKLVHAGRVGTGFNQRVLAQLSERLRELEVDQSPLAAAPVERGLHWVRPLLVAEVEFTAWTRDGVLRHPTFRGLREDRDPEDIQLPEAALAGASSKPDQASKGVAKRRANASDTAEVAGVTLTNPGRILYPEQGITKLALAQYYEEVERWLLPQLAFRPLSLVRCPEGHTKECFFQKHPGTTMSKSIPRVQIDDKEGQGTYLYVHTLSDVIALVQTGALELHVWGSRVDDVEHPDRLVFDLDPGPDVPLAEILRVARDLRERLADLGLESFPRTTGGKGLHLVVPLVAERSWDEVKLFCRAVARLHARDDPQRVVASMAKSKRRGRIFVDYLRNGRGSTAIASYSTRARPNAPVAVPVAWDELTEALRPDRYNLENLRRRLAGLRVDPWQGFEMKQQRLTSEMLSAVGIAEGEKS